MDEYLRQILTWNENHPIGTPVKVRKMDETTFDTVTTTEAMILGTDVVVVWVNHEYGCRLLYDVEAI